MTRPLLIAIVAGTYVFPSVVALVRRHPAWRDVVGLNLLLGWTVFGWIGAAIWAFSRRAPVGLNPSQGPGAG